MPVLSEFRGLLTGLSLVGAAILLAVSFDLGIYGQPLLQSLRFHIGIVFLLLPIGLWAMGAALRATIMMGVVLLSLGQGALITINQQQTRLAVEATHPGAAFKVLSFNVLGSNPSPQAATDYIQQTSADIVAVLEAGGLKTGLDALSVLYPYKLGCAPDYGCDSVLLSKTPFETSKIAKIGPFARFRFITAVTTINGQKMTVVVMHLSKPYFDDASKEELWQIRRGIKNVEGPAVLMGDFNAAAWSDQIDDFARHSNLVPPPVYPGTWPPELGWLGIPIDNMFTRGGAIIQSIAATPEAFGSNHRGLLARVAIGTVAAVP